MACPNWNLLQSQFPDTVSGRDLEHFDLPSVIEETRPERFGRTGLRREPGKLVEELRPPVEEDKGTGLLRAIATAGVDVVAYAGDDRGDLPALAAVLASGGEALVPSRPMTTVFSAADGLRSNDPGIAAAVAVPAATAPARRSVIAAEVRAIFLVTLKILR